MLNPFQFGQEYAVSPADGQNTPLQNGVTWQWHWTISDADDLVSGSRECGVPFYYHYSQVNRHPQ